MNWIEVKLETEKKYEEILVERLYSLGAQGLSIEDSRDIKEVQKTIGSWELFDENLLNGLDENIFISSYFENDNKFSLSEVKEVLSKANAKILSMEVDKIEDKDWSENWKKYYKPLRIGNNLIIKPTWEEYSAKKEDILIDIDPGMAFGTGTHETTELCSKALEDNVKTGDVVYDIGCGSGILSIISAKLGAKKVIGVDIDPLSIKASNENIKINRVEDIVEVYEGDLLDKIDGKADIIVSNILADAIIEMLPKLKQNLNKNGLFILSGIILEKEEKVKNAIEKLDFEIINIYKKKEWVCIIGK